jgi:hypothetical protein
MQYKLVTKDKLILALTVDHKRIEQHKLRVVSLEICIPNPYFLN